MALSPHKGKSVDIKSVHHDQDTNTVTIKVNHKQNHIVCQALEVIYKEEFPVYFVLDRLIHSSSDEPKGTWQVSGAFVTEIARTDSLDMFSLSKSKRNLKMLS